MSLNGAFDLMFSSQKRSAATDASYLGNFGGFFSLGNTGATSHINYKKSLGLSAVYNAVEQISNDIAKIPFSVNCKKGNNRESQPSHPAQRLISYEPNSLMTTFIFRKTMVISVLLKGNALAKIEHDSIGKPIETNYINWDLVRDIRIKDGQLVYDVQGYAQPLLASEVLHFKQFSHNGIVGISCISYAAQQLNMAIDVQTYSATNFENKGVRQGVVETDKVISKDTSKLAIATAIQGAFSQKDATRVAVLDEGMKWKAITVTPQEAQIIETGRFNIEEIARMFNIAPHKIKSLQQSTNNNIEQQTLDHASDTIQPYITNFEQEYAKKLFTSKEREAGFYIRGNMNVLLRADIKSRGEFYSKMVNSGVYCRQEVRQKEDENDGPTFLEEFLTPVNTYTELQLKANISKTLAGIKPVK
jgi:HK97 family phage portal protein